MISEIQISVEQLAKNCSCKSPASKADVASRYKRLQRFFRYFEFDYAVVAGWIFKLFLTNHPGKKIYLTIDRTNWFWGKSKN